WALLVDSVRRLEVPLLRARLGKRLSRPVVRSGGLGVGKVDELGLNAQETRIYATIDGTRTGEEVLQAHDPSTSLRLLYLLTELGHLGFTEVGDEDETAPPAAKNAPPPEPVITPPPQPAKPAAAPPPAAPKFNREAPRAPARPAAPPVMKAVAPPHPAPPKPATPA